MASAAKRWRTHFHSRTSREKFIIMMTVLTRLYVHVFVVLLRPAIVSSNLTRRTNKVLLLSAHHHGAPLSLTSRVKEFFPGISCHSAPAIFDLFVWKLRGTWPLLAHLATPLVQMYTMSLSQIQKELWPFYWLQEVAAAILDFFKCRWTKFCTSSGKCCFRQLWTHIDRQKKSVQQFHLKCDFLLTIT